MKFYHCDQRGLLLALIDPASTVAWRAEYDEWGNLLSEESPTYLQQLIRLPGQQYDDESGLHYNRLRYYNPGLGRYITQDPIGVEGGGLGTTVSGLLGKVPFLSNIFGDYVSGLVSEGVGDNVEKVNSKDGKK